jgi:hypothetical protein
VVAVLTILTIRVYLKAAQYPQIGGNGLHVAHVLWGGLGMVIAIVLLLAFLTSTTQRMAAVVGGAGFGAFIDELGKFVTADNNYFFKPTAALIYSVFIVLFLMTRQIRRVRRLTPVENLVNAIELSKHVALGRLTFAQRDRALVLLAASDPSNPLVPLLRREFMAATPVEERPSVVGRLARGAQRRYVRAVDTRWFRRIIAGLFILQALGVVLGAIAVMVLTGAFLAGFISARTTMSEAGVDAVSSGVQSLASLVGGGFTVAGVLRLRRRRLQAYRWFEFSVLLDLFLGQPFTLLDAGFIGLVGVFIDLALLGTLRFMIGQEHDLAARAGVSPAGPSAAASPAPSARSHHPYAESTRPPQGGAG